MRNYRNSIRGSGGQEIADLAEKAEGLPRHISTHAAGVVIGADDLSNLVPLQTREGDHHTAAHE